MRPQPLVKVHCASYGNSNGDDNEDNGNHSEGGEGLPNWEVICNFGTVIHPYKLENEIGEGCKVKKLYICLSIGNSEAKSTMQLTMMKAAPNLFSFLVQKAAIIRIPMVIGIAAIVRPNSLSVR